MVRPVRNASRAAPMPFFRHHETPFVVRQTPIKESKINTPWSGGGNAGNAIQAPRSFEAEVNHDKRVLAYTIQPKYPQTDCQYAVNERHASYSHRVSA